MAAGSRLSGFRYSGVEGTEIEIKLLVELDMQMLLDYNKILHDLPHGYAYYSGCELGMSNARTTRTGADEENHRDVTAWGTFQTIDCIIKECHSSRPTT